MYTDQQMIQLSQSYLQKVGEMKHSYPSVEHLLQHCVDIYNKRKEIGLEVKLNEESGVYE